MNFENYKFRCSRLSEIMTNITSNELTKGHITSCRKIFREEKYGRRQRISSKYIDKGILMEDDGITLLSRFEKKAFFKNKDRFTNDYITGEPDLFLIQSGKIEEGFDVKCSWSIHTFPFSDDTLDSSYYFQDMGYMALTDCDKWTTAYCLVNAPANLISDEKKKVYFKMGCPKDNDKDYVNQCIEIEIDMIYDMKQFLSDNPAFDLHVTKWEHDIPISERVLKFPVVRDNNLIDKIYDRVSKCRNYINENLLKSTLSVAA